MFNKPDPVQQRVERAKDEFTLAADRVMDAIKEQAREVIVDLGATVRETAHETSTALSDDVIRMSGAVAKGLRNVKEEIQVPQSIREHPFAWVAGGLAFGAVGFTALRAMTARPARIAAVQAQQEERRIVAKRGSSVAKTLALAALDIGLNVWLSRRQQPRRGVLASLLH